MRQHPSLDVIAAQRASRRSSPAADATNFAGDANAAGPEDSRSSSSASSPVPADNEESDFFLAANDSQSSLGVPNLQDMQVADDECLPPINRLPNEILISIFAKLSQSSDILHCMLSCKRWARNAVDILWHRPSCTNWQKHSSICQTLGLEAPYFSYRDFIKRLNLAALADKVNDGSVMPLASCTRVERLTLTNCKGLTDSGLTALVQNSTHLLALDISGDDQITEASIFAIADNCKRLQGLNISNCNKISNVSMIKLAQSCRYIKRLKLNDCRLLTDEPILAFAEHCPNILEIDLHQCRQVGNEPVTSLLSKGQSLRELRLASCELVDDSAFLSLPPGKTYEHLRILDLTSCARLTDRAVEKIVHVAPRLRNIVLAKCRNITDAAVFAISELGKNLHYVHLGHCSQLTDEAVKRLVHSCNRIRYIDLGCCAHLTDNSVTRLAALPKLKRIGLVKCVNITDESVYALAKANQRLRSRRDAEGNIIHGEYYASSHSSLERVHLSYCANLTLKSITKLLNCCPRLTHLSLTGVHAFLRDDLEAFCRDAPPEFTEHQRQVFCVFSGQGVIGLRRYLNSERDFTNQDGETDRHRTPHAAFANPAAVAPPAADLNNGDGALDEGEPDVVEDDDVLEDGNEMVIDTQPLLGTHVFSGAGVDGQAQVAIPPPPPPPSLSTLNPFPGLASFPTQAAGSQDQSQGVPIVLAPAQPPPQQAGPHHVEEQGGGDDAMDTSPTIPANGTASTAGGGFSMLQAARSRQASGAGPIPAEAGPSTASTLALPTGPGRVPASAPGAGRTTSRSNGSGPTSP